MPGSRKDRVRRRRLALTAGLLVVLAAVVLGITLGPGGHRFADGAPTVISSPGEPGDSTSPALPTAAPAGSSGGPSTASPSTSSSPKPIRLVGLGDSVTAATNCDCTDFVTALGRRVASADDVTVDSVNRGVPGATAADLDDALRNDDDLQQTVAGADIVVVTIGANDLAPDLDSFTDGGCPASCYDPDVDEMKKDLGDILDQIRQLRNHTPTTVLVTTYWNVFTDGDVAEENQPDGYLAWSDQLTRAANAAICSAAVAHQAGCVDLYTPFKGSGSDDPTSLLADDGDHPNAAGEQLITEALFKALRPTLSPPPASPSG